jgi:antitoxin (DNA-binding transcriptional repressor) of toxin-antitoxin stability system
VKVYSVAELADGKIQTVIRELDSEPVLITQHGRFVALISPVNDRHIADEIIAHLAPKEAT